VPSFTNELDRRSQQNRQTKIQKRGFLSSSSFFFFFFFEFPGKVVREWRQAVAAGGRQRMVVAAGGSECLVLELG